MLWICGDHQTHDLLCKHMARILCLTDLQGAGSGLAAQPTACFSGCVFARFGMCDFLFVYASLFIARVAP